jgi:hypothetical protein
LADILPRRVLLTLNTVIRVDAMEVPLLYVTVVPESEAEDYRLQAWGERCDWNDVLALFESSNRGENLL